MSRGFLLDTDVISATARAEPPAQVISWLRERQSQLYTSAVAMAEICYGIERLPTGRRRRRLEQWFDEVIENMGDHILRFDTRAAHHWGKMQALLEREARRMPLEDSYMAAIAMRHNLVVATRNIADFDRSGIQTVNPFEASR